MLVLSTVLGGVYVPTPVLPPTVAPMAEWIPFTSGLRALRQTFLLGYPLSAAGSDLFRLMAAAAVFALAGVVVLRWSFAYARRAGSLAQY